MSLSLIRDRVKVSILRDTKVPDRLFFGLPLFIGPTDEGVIVQSYRDYDEVLEVYDETDPEAKAALAFFSQTPRPTQLLIGYKAAADTYVEALTAIRAIRDDFFCVMMDSREEADVLAMAAAVKPLRGLRQFWTASDDADILDGTVTSDIASQLKALVNDQARVVFHTDDELFPEMAMAGRVLLIPETGNTGPGSAAWHDQPVVGIPGDDFTASQREALEDKNAEFFIEVGGAVRAMGGKMAGGEWGDIMHGISWLETRLAEDVYGLFASAANRLSKVAYTDEGIAAVEATVRSRLDIAVATGLLVEGYQVSVPLIEQTLLVDRVERRLKDVNFEAQLAGAIKFVEINGVVTV